MNHDPGILELQRATTSPHPCCYLARETATLDYRIIIDISPRDYEELLRRGWRRFGCQFFRPACATCQKCRSLRIDVQRFHPSRSDRRTLKKNADLRVVVRPASVSPDHVRIYNAYNGDMHRRRGWPRHRISMQEYEETFLSGDWTFAHEFLYFDRDDLLGVGLADILDDSISAVYFFHDPDWRPQSPGVFSALQQLEYARRQSLRYQYMGYWIAECPSMSYKTRYRPHEILSRHVQDEEEPLWEGT